MTTGGRGRAKRGVGSERGVGSGTYISSGYPPGWGCNLFIYLTKYGIPV